VTDLSGRPSKYDSRRACEAGGVSDLDPTQVVAAFDSASVLHAAAVAPLMASHFLTSVARL
jgi:hypothetical protein